MSKTHLKYIIVGAGLSGLTTAYQLLRKGEDDILILEGSNKIGGRVNTLNGIDLGATWLQNHHQNIFQLLDALKLSKFEQYSKGKSILVYNSIIPAHYFENNSNEPSAYRIVNGSITLIDELAKQLLGKIMTNSNVLSIKENKSEIILETNTKTYSAEKVIITTPPKIAREIQYEPKLPNKLTAIMESTHTWMSNAIKVGITFTAPFWRKKGLSGTIIGQINPVIELYDHCDYNEKMYGLMGFVNEALREESSENRKEQILSYLEKYFGPEIRNYVNYHEKDWSKDEYTSSKNLQSVYMSPRYGNPIFQDFYMHEKLLFSGAETSPVHGGYMDGAVYSGLNAANKLLSK